MNEFKEILGRVNFNGVIGYLFYGTESEIDIGAFEERIKKSDNIFFETLENMFPSASRHDEDLFSIVLDYSIAHDEVYFEMGLIVGFRLLKNIENAISIPEIPDLKSILKKKEFVDAEESKTEKDSMLESLFAQRTQVALETTLKEDTDYQKSVKTQNESIDVLEMMQLNKNQKLAIDKAMSAVNFCGSEYGRVAYGQGFKDAMKLIFETIKCTE